MKMNIALPLILGIFSTILSLQINAGEEAIPFTIQTETLPNIVFRDEPVYLRVNAYIDRPLPEDVTTKPPADVPVSLSAEMQTSDGQEAENIGTLQAQLPPYSDAVFQGLFSTEFNDAKKIGELVFTISGTNDHPDQAVAVAFRPAANPGQDLTARGYELQTLGGKRAMLVTSHWDESAYRRWAVPITLARWVQAPKKSNALLLTAENPERRKAFYQRLEKNLARENRELRIIAPTPAPAAPILLLLAQAGSVKNRDEKTVIIAPGLADIIYGTPTRLFARGMHALVTRMENVHKRERTGFFLFLPSLPPSLAGNGKAYIKILRRLGEERHLSVVEMDLPESAWGTVGEQLYPLPEWQKKNAEHLARTSNPIRYQIFIHIAAGIILLMAVIFIVVQIATRRRLKRAIAISCAQGPE